MNGQSVLRGAMAGILATVPMTAVIGLGKTAGWMVTPPPKQITARAQDESGLREEMSPPVFTLTWLGAHVAFGAGCGALYSEGRSWLPASPVTSGMVYGMLIWAVAYGAVLPGLDLYPNLLDDAHTRTAVMLAAHAIFGVALAAVTARLS